MKKDWVYKKLGEVCKIIGGGTPNKKNASYYNGDIKWATVRDMNVDYLETTEFTITKDGLENSSSNVIPAGEIIIATRVGLGKVCLLKSNTAINQDLKGVVPIKNDSINRKFLFYWFKSISDYIVKNGVGATVQGVKLTFVNNINFPLPPLSEQKAIVEYLDSSFAKIDKLKENAAKNLEEAKALFQSALKDALEPKEGWEEKTIQNVCEILNGFAFPSASFMNKGCLKVIKITNVGVGEFIEDNSRLSIEHQDNSAKVNENDIVIALTRTIIADGLKKARVPFSYDGALLNQRVAALTPKKNVVENSFVYYYLGTAQVSKYVLSKVNTLMQPNLSIGDLKKMPIPLPSLQEQQSIVSFLDSLSEMVNTLQQNYSRICDECDALKQAILRQVFE